MQVQRWLLFLFCHFALANPTYWWHKVQQEHQLGWRPLSERCNEAHRWQVISGHLIMQLASSTSGIVQWKSRNSQLTAWLLCLSSQQYIRKRKMIVKKRCLDVTIMPTFLNKQHDWIFAFKKKWLDLDRYCIRMAASAFWIIVSTQALFCYYECTETQRERERNHMWIIVKWSVWNSPHHSCHTSASEYTHFNSHYRVLLLIFSLPHPNR